MNRYTRKRLSVIINSIDDSLSDLEQDDITLDDISAISSRLSDTETDLEFLKDEESAKLSNMEEHFPDSERTDRQQEAVDILEELLDDLSALTDDLSDIEDPSELADLIITLDTSDASSLL